MNCCGNCGNTGLGASTHPRWRHNVQRPSSSLLHPLFLRSVWLRAFRSSAVVSVVRRSLETKAGVYRRDLSYQVMEEGLRARSRRLMISSGGISGGSNQACKCLTKSEVRHDDPGSWTQKEKRKKSGGQRYNSRIHAAPCCPLGGLICPWWHLGVFAFLHGWWSRVSCECAQV